LWFELNQDAWQRLYIGASLSGSVQETLQHLKESLILKKSIDKLHCAICKGKARGKAGKELALNQLWGTGVCKIECAVPHRRLIKILGCWHIY
jgi:hypothetical protein